MNQYLPSPSSFYKPSFPFIESKLNPNHSSVWLWRSFRMSWLIALLPLQFTIILLFFKIPSFPIPIFLIPSTSRHRNWNLLQALIYPIVSSLLWAIPGTGGLPPLFKESKSIPFSAKVLCYFNKIKVNVKQVDIKLSSAESKEWIKNEALDVTGVVVPVDVSCFWLEVILEDDQEEIIDLKDLEIKVGFTPRVKSQNKEDEKVVLYFVGGGYVIGSPLVGTRCYNLARESGLKILGVNYRKALNTTKAFPAALQDGITAYAYLLSLGYRNIILAGDSAGAGLALTLLLYLGTSLYSEPPTKSTPLVLPTKVLLYSPWVDLTLSSYKDFEPSIDVTDDFLNPTMMKSSRDSYLINLPHLQHSPHMTSSHPFLSPALRTSLPTLKSLSQAYTQLPLKILIISGSSELLAPEIKGLVKNLKQSGNGFDLEWIEEKDELHAFFLFPHYISPASERALVSAGKFLRKQS